MQTNAQFLLIGWFNLTGRGLVITGQITSGEVSPGDFICLNDEIIKIKSVEIGNIKPDDFFIGLMLDIKHSSEVLLIFNKLKGQNLSVLKEIAN